ncbi:MAG: ATP12 family protein [Pseudomonadota bacterium]
MSEWKQKRFWTDSTVMTSEHGYSVLLDGRSVKTPAKTAFLVPTRALAEAVAKEWAAQEDTIDPRTMPYTRTANAAIDKVAAQHGEVADLLADYGDTDLLCYRAEHPDGLVDRQADLWDPALNWASDALGARLEPRSGLMHAPQPAGALAGLRARVHKLSNFELAAFHDLVSLTGSLVLGFAAMHDWKSPDEIWDISRLDERWQEEHWGLDEEAAEQAAIKRTAFHHAKRFYDACQPLSA